MRSSRRRLFGRAGCRGALGVDRGSGRRTAQPLGNCASRPPAKHETEQATSRGCARWANRRRQPQPPRHRPRSDRHRSRCRLGPDASRRSSSRPMSQLLLRLLSLRIRECRRTGGRRIADAREIGGSAAWLSRAVRLPRAGETGTSRVGTVNGCHPDTECPIEPDTEGPARPDTGLNRTPAVAEPPTSLPTYASLPSPQQPGQRR